MFVAEGTQERWLEDIARGDSVYESVFSYERYLSCIWADAKSPRQPRMRGIHALATGSLNGIFCRLVSSAASRQEAALHPVVAVPLRRTLSGPNRSPSVVPAVQRHRTPRTVLRELRTVPNRREAYTRRVRWCEGSMWPTSVVAYRVD